jgi:hypothetical protein
MVVSYCVYIVAYEKAFADGIKGGVADEIFGDITTHVILTSGVERAGKKTTVLLCFARVFVREDEQRVETRGRLWRLVSTTTEASDTGTGWRSGALSIAGKIRSLESKQASKSGSHGSGTWIEIDSNQSNTRN